MATQTYKINGMTCNSCVEKVTKQLTQIPGVASVKVDLQSKTADIDSVEPVSLLQLRMALSDLPKYSADYYDDVATSEALSTEKKSLLQTYKPLIVVFIFVVLVSLAFQSTLHHFSGELFMRHIMAGFFIGLSFFKFLDLRAFSTAFSKYDPLAKNLRGYGRLYPFIELALGLMFVAGFGLKAANILTIIVLTTTTIGVIKMITSKNQIQCACLGAGFNLPLSWVTVGENAVMVLMAIYSLFIG